MRSKNYFVRAASLIFTLSIYIAGFYSCTPKADDEGKFIGLQLYSIREDMKEDPAGTLAKVGEMGYKFVETAGYSNGQFYGIDAAEFKILAEASGLKVLSSHTGPNIPEDGDWDKTMQWWDDCIEAHKAVGALYIVKPSMGRDAYASLEGLKNYCDYYNAIGEKCNKAGLLFGYHNHSKEFSELEGKIIYDFMLENTAPDKVFFQMDLYWVVEGGADPLSYFDKYPGRFELWHVKDEAEVGASGKMNFEAIFNIAEKSGMKYHIVEVEKYNYEPIESVRKSFEFLMNADYVK